MDFTQIYETVAPYFASGAVATVLGVVVGIIVKVRSVLNEVRTNTDIKELFKKALPSELTVSVSKLAETEINRLTAEIRGDFISAIEKNTVLLTDLATALASLRSIPKSLKEEIARHCESAVVEPSSVKVALIPEVEKAADMYVE